MAKTYIIKRTQNGSTNYIGEFDSAFGMFMTGSAPKEFTAINQAIKLAEIINDFIGKDQAKYEVFEISAVNSKETTPPKKVTEEKHEAEIELPEDE